MAEQRVEQTPSGTHTSQDFRQYRNGQSPLEHQRHQRGNAAPSRHDSASPKSRRPWNPSIGSTPTQQMNADPRTALQVTQILSKMGFEGADTDDLLEFSNKSYVIFNKANISVNDAVDLFQFALKGEALVAWGKVRRENPDTPDGGMVTAWDLWIEKLYTPDKLDRILDKFETAILNKFSNDKQEPMLVVFNRYIESQRTLQNTLNHVNPGCVSDRRFKRQISRSCRSHDSLWQATLKERPDETSEDLVNRIQHILQAQQDRESMERVKVRQTKTNLEKPDSEVMFSAVRRFPKRFNQNGKPKVSFSQNSRESRIFRRYA